MCCGMGLRGGICRGGRGRGGRRRCRSGLGGGCSGRGGGWGCFRGLCLKKGLGREGCLRLGLWVCCVVGGGGGRPLRLGG